MYYWNQTDQTIFAQCCSSKCKAAVDLMDLGDDETWQIVDDAGSLHDNGAKVPVGCCPTDAAPCNSCQDSECGTNNNEHACEQHGCCGWFDHHGRPDWCGCIV